MARGDKEEVVLFNEETITLTKVRGLLYPNKVFLVGSVDLQLDCDLVIIGASWVSIELQLDPTELPLVPS